MASKFELSEVIGYGGSSFLAAWFLLFFSGEIWGLDYDRSAELVGILSLVSITSCFISLVILSFLGQKSIFTIQIGKPYFVLLGILTSAGTIGVVFEALLPEPVFILSCALIGTCGAFYVSAVVMQLARLTPRSILSACGVIFLIGIFIYSFAFYVPWQLTVVILCLLPFLASWFFTLDKAPVDLPSTYPDEFEHEQKRSPIGWRVTLLLSLFMLFSCVVRGYLPYYLDIEAFSYIRSFSIILMLIGGAIVVVLPAILPAGFRLSNLYRAILLSGVVFFALLPIFGMDNALILILSDAYRGVCALLALTFFASLARRIPFYGFRNVSGSLAIYVALGLVGWLTGMFLYYMDFSDDILRIYSSIQCVVVLLAFILLFRQPEIERFLDRDASEPPAAQEENEISDNAVQMQDQEVRGGRWRQRCASLAKEKGLTAREEEVFILLAKGFKAQNISERLSVSYNTTRAHIRNIYQKCDVHSQQEFVDLIESPLDPESPFDPPERSE